MISTKFPVSEGLHADTRRKTKSNGIIVEFLLADGCAFPFDPFDPLHF